MQLQKLRIIIVDDHQGYINAVKIFMRNRPDIEIIGEANNAFQFQEIMKTSNPDLVLMDINLPGINGIVAGEKALNMNRQLKVLGVTMSDDYDIHFNMLMSGFSGGILKNQFIHDFDNALNIISTGNVYFPVLNQ